MKFVFSAGMMTTLTAQSPPNFHYSSSLSLANRWASHSFNLRLLTDLLRGTRQNDEERSGKCNHRGNDFRLRLETFCCSLRSHFVCRYYIQLGCRRELTRRSGSAQRILNLITAAAAIETTQHKWSEKRPKDLVSLSHISMRLFFSKMLTLLSLERVARDGCWVTGLTTTQVVFFFFSFSPLNKWMRIRQWEVGKGVKYCRKKRVCAEIGAPPWLRI